jgi:predicted SprT family Zn-dependent metalloprotease
MFWKKLITVSGPLAEINSEDIVLDTILHEIAHALAGHEAKHGRMWQVMARSIGAKAERCADISEVVQVEKPYAGTCGDCGAVVYRSRRPGPNMLLTGYHSPCSRKVNKGRITWKHNGISFGTPIVWR